MRPPGRAGGGLPGEGAGKRCGVRIVITGASGNVGTSLLTALTDGDHGDHDIVGIARRQPSWHPPGVQWVEADVTTADLTSRFAGADAVVHLAWLIQPSHDPMALWQANVTGTKRVIEATVAAGVPRLVHASSVGAYAPGPKQVRVTEDHPSDGIPTLGYSWQKAYCERLLDTAEIEHPDLAVVRLRPGLIFKREAASEIRRLFLGRLAPTGLLDRRVARSLVERSPVAFQVVHSLDAGRAFALATTAGDEVRGAFNVATEPPLGRLRPPPRPLLAPVRWLASGAWRARLVAAQPGWLDLVAAVPLMDTTRARTELGWTPRFDAYETFEALIGGLHDGAAGPTPPLAAAS